jgi:hypothetical protein
MNTPQLKQLAIRIRDWLGSYSIIINHSESLDYSAALIGLRNWPEVKSFPERVELSELNLAAAGRLARRMMANHRHHATPEALLAALEATLSPARAIRLESKAPLTIERLADAWRRTAINEGVNNALERTDMLAVLAAALGYGSFDEYRASAGEATDIRQAAFWVVDTVTVSSPMARLGLGVEDAELFDCLWQAVKDLNGPERCESATDLHDKLQPLVDDAALQDDDVGSQMVTTNSVGPWDCNLELDPADENLPDPGEDLVVAFAGTVTGEADDDRPFCGDTVAVEGAVTLNMVGRRLCGAPRIDIQSAEVDWSWAAGDDDDVVDRPSYSHGEAVALELDLPKDYGVFFEDAELSPTTSSAGVPNGYIVDLSTCPVNQVITELAAKNGGSLRLRVLGTLFEFIRRDPWE